MRSILTVATLALLVAVAYCAGQAHLTNEQNQALTSDTTRSSFKLSKMMDFETFKRAFNKHYSSRMEEMSRAKLFMARAFNALISTIKYKFGITKFYLGVNEFSDLTPKERQQILGSRHDISAPTEPSVEETELIKPEKAEEGIKEIIESTPSSKSLEVAGTQTGVLSELRGFASRVQAAASDLVARAVPVSDNLHIDHRECFGPIKHQFKCGACYIFTVTSMYEWLYCKANGEKVSFSEQYAIDCGSRTGLKGCDGGMEVDVEEFYSEYGLELAEKYPYAAANEYCPVSMLIIPQLMGRYKVKSLGLTPVRYPMIEAALSKTPLLVALSTKPSFEDYGGGVSDGDCIPGRNLHAVVVVGMGTQDGEEYWLIRNTYGHRWGENGYYKLNKNTNCIHKDFLSPDAISKSLTYRSFFRRNPLYLEALFKIKQAT